MAKFRRILAIAMVMCMLVSVLPMQALAADGTEPDTKLDLSGSIVAEVHPSSTNTYYDENGVPTVEITVQQTTTSGTSADGATVTGQETVTDTTTFHPDGSVQVETEIKGNEKKEWSDLEVELGQEVPDIEVSFSQSGTVSDTKSETYKDPEFVIPSEGDYDMTRTETSVDREYSATVGGLETGLVVGGQKTDIYSPAGPSDYEGKQYVDWDKAQKHNHTEQGGSYSNGYDPHYFEGVFNNGDDYYINKVDNRGNVVVAPKPDASGENANIDQGYDFLWSGTGDATYGSIPVFAEKIEWLEKVYKTDSEGNVIVDENGEPVIDPLRSVVDMVNTTFVQAGNKMTNDPLTGKEATGMVGSPGQFALMNEYGQYFYAYCMDAATGTSPDFNSWYQLRNLEDAIESEGNSYGYISEDEAAMIRAIALNGYWGTDPNVYETNEDGSIKYEPVLDENGNPVMEKQYVYEYDEEGKLIYEEAEDGKLYIKRTQVEVPVTKPVAKLDENGEIVTDPTAMGSIASLKQLMLDTYNTDSKVTVRYPGSNEGHEVSFYELIDGLTEAEALAVTQAAIWAFANANDPSSGTVVGVLSASKYHNTDKYNADGSVKSYGSYLTQYRPRYLTDKGALESDARMQALYELFMTKLDPIYEDDDLNKASEIIPSGEAISEVAVVIKDKVEEHTDNQDDNDANDVYNSDLSFTLAFVPDEDSDDMLVYLYNGNEIMRDSNGDPIVRRLAGTNDEGENYDGVEYDEATGSYLLTGLQLSENTDYSFNLKLEGVQHLDKGVYIYQAHGGERKSGQTLVGLVEGDQYFEASATMSLNFEVTETNDVVVERVWREEFDPITYAPAPINEEPQIYRLNHQDGLEEIADEEVPLAAPVTTGDSSVIWVVVIAMSMLMLCAFNLAMAKRPRGKHEAI